MKGLSEGVYQAWTSPIKKIQDSRRMLIVKRLLSSLNTQGQQRTPAQQKENAKAEKIIRRTSSSKCVSFDESVFYKTAHEDEHDDYECDSCINSLNHTRDSNLSEERYSEVPVLCRVKIYDAPSVSKVKIIKTVRNANTDLIKQTKAADTSMNLQQETKSYLEHNNPDSGATMITSANKQMSKDSFNGSKMSKMYEDEFASAVEDMKTSTIANRKAWDVMEKGGVRLLDYFVKNDINPATFFEKKKFRSGKVVNRSVEEKFVVNLYESLGRKRKDAKKQRPSVSTLEFSSKQIKQIDGDNNKANMTFPEMRDEYQLTKWNKLKPAEADKSMHAFLSLKQAADVQCEIMKQASKALEVCLKRKKRFEQVELERVLLIAGYKHSAIINQIRKNEYAEPLEMESRGHKAKITLSDITVPLKSTGSKNKKKRSKNEWFVCIVSCGTEVLFTKAAKRTSAEEVVFPEGFAFEDVKSNFSVNVSVYSMIFGEDAKKSENLLRRPKSESYSSYKKIFYKSVHTYEAVESDIRVSSFTRQGFTQLKRNDFFGKGPWALQNVQEGSAIAGTIGVSLRVEKIDIVNHHSGFLTIGMPSDKNLPVWNRKWCVLDGTDLKFWNYPSEEGINEPILSIDLKNCLTDGVAAAERAYCPRPRTLKMDIGTASLGEFFIRLYLSADNFIDFEVWRRELNAVIRSLGKWRMLRYSKDETST